MLFSLRYMSNPVPNVFTLCIVKKVAVRMKESEMKCSSHLTSTTCKTPSPRLNPSRNFLLGGFSGGNIAHVFFFCLRDVFEKYIL